MCYLCKSLLEMSWIRAYILTPSYDEAEVSNIVMDVTCLVRNLV